MDIGKIIANLLYDYDTVTIPNFGGLTLYTLAAETNQVAGKITPPSKKLSFNSNLVLNDGLLLAKIQEVYNLPQEAAQSALEQFVESLKIRLQNGESVEIEQIGYFFQSGEHIQFSAANINYDTSSYGLPEVKSDIIHRLGDEKVAFQKEEEAHEALTTTPPREYGRLLQWLLPVLGLLAIAIIVYTLKDNLFTGRSNNLKEELEERVPDGQTTTDDLIDSTDVEVIGGDEEIVDVEAPTPSPNQKVARIVVGAFSERPNAESLARKIQLAGYTPFSETRNGKRYVGISYAYETQEDFDKAFAKIKQRFNEDAWILEK